MLLGIAHISTAFVFVKKKIENLNFPEILSNPLIF